VLAAVVVVLTTWQAQEVRAVAEQAVRVIKLAPTGRPTQAVVVVVLPRIRLVHMLVATVAPALSL
jgi:hypothetical protein